MSLQKLHETWSEVTQHILDPECPVDEWWALAAVFPLEAQASVLYPLLTLEAPDRWQRLEAEHVTQWVENGLGSLSWRKQELFAADCVEHVHPIWLERWPKAMGVLNAIEARRQFARDELEDQNWTEARHQVARLVSSNDPVAVQYVVYAAAQPETKQVVAYASLAASWAWLLPNGEQGTASENRLAAFRWQWKRLQCYLPKIEGVR